MKKNRKSNYELLRIIAMLMIIGTHGLSSTNLAELLPETALNRILVPAVDAVSKYGVNLYALITGYFMVQRRSVSVKKVIKLLLDVAMYGIILYGVSIMLGLQAFSISGCVKALVPMLAGYRWFVTAYCVLYLLCPLINAALQSLSKKNYLTFLLLYTFFFSFWPSFLPHPPLNDWGYSFHHLIYIYMIGGYLRLHGCSCSTKKALLLFALATAGTMLLMGTDAISLPIINTAQATAAANNSLLLVCASTCLFIAFGKLNIQSGVINKLASCAFAVFLIHGDYNTMDYMFNNLLHLGDIASKALWLPLYLASLILIYLVCALADICKQKLLDKPINKLLDMIPFFNHQITSQEE